MGTNRTTWMAAVLGTVAVAGMMGCHKDAIPGLGKGSAAISANVKLSIADVANLKVHVTSSTMSSPLDVPLVKSGNQFSALVSDLPVGSDYSFTASAKNAGGTEIYTGSATGQSIVKNQTANIIINMIQTTPGTGLTSNAPVIDSISASALSVAPNGTVTINATAHDPDQGQTALMGWAWTSTCGTLGAPVTTPGSDTVHASSQVTFTAPAADATCAVNLTVTDALGVLKNVASLSITVGTPVQDVGNARITAIPNSAPVISGLTATPTPLNKGVATTLTVSATDVDGDAMTYAWTSPCAGVFATAAAASTTFTLDSASTATSCDMQVVVSDGKNVPITNHLTLAVQAPATSSSALPPVFGYDYQSQDTTNAGDVVKLAIIADQNCSGGTIGLTWSASDGTPLVATTPAAIGLDPAMFTNPASAVTYTAPANGSGATVTVTATCSKNSATATHAFSIAPLVTFCTGKADNTDCTTGTDKCNPSKCVNQACVAAPVVCSQTGVAACQVNTCDSATGLCAAKNAVDNTVCSDNNACTTGDLCNAGACIPGVAKVCAAPASFCQVATCDPVSAACVTADKPDTTVCNDGNGCTTPDVCTAGVCGGTAVVCPVGSSCVESTDHSSYTCPVAGICMDAKASAKKWVPPMSNMGIGATGTPWAVGQIYNPFDFGSGTVSSSGSADIYLTKIDPTTTLATQTFTFGDTGGSDQIATAVAVASSGNVGMIGSFTGEIDFTGNNSDGSGASGNPGTAGLDFLQNASSIPFFAVFDGTSTGTYITPLKAHMVDVGTGALLSVSSNPGQNAFAICGKTSKAVPNWSTSGATKGVITGGNAAAGGGMDIVVAKIDATTGLVLWGKQFGGAGDQICESVSIDNNGDVIIAGGYTGTLNFGGTTTAFPVASDTTLALLYVAKLNGSTGAAITAQTWGSAGRSDAYGLAVDANNNIVVAGSLGGPITFSPTISIVDAGLTDAFVAKFTTALVPVWAKSFGDANYDQTAKSVATSSNGDVFVGGSFKGSLGTLGLTSASTTALDAWSARLASADGSTLCATPYGDAPGAQAVSTITVARAATGALADSIMIGGAFSSKITLGSVTLDTGSASLAASYIARLTP